MRIVIITHKYNDTDICKDCGKQTKWTWIRSCKECLKDTIQIKENREKSDKI